MFFPSISGPGFGQQFMNFMDQAGFTPSAIIEKIQTASQNFGVAMAEVSLLILAATWTVRFLMVTFKELLDGDFIEMLTEWIGLAVMAVFLLVFLNAWSGGTYSIPDMANAMMQQIAGFAAQAAGVPAGGDPLDGVFSGITTSILAVMGQIWDTIFASIDRMMHLFTPAGAIENTVIPIVTRSVPPIIPIVEVFNMVLGLLATLAVGILACVLLFHALTGFIMLNVVIAFGPLTLAAYPLIDSWAPKAVSTMATAIVQMIAAIFILSIVSGLLTPMAAIVTRTVN